jgi:hypothetical protein
MLAQASGQGLDGGVVRIGGVLPVMTAGQKENPGRSFRGFFLKFLLVRSLLDDLGRTFGGVNHICITSA